MKPLDQISISDLVKWIVKHRKNTQEFIGWTEDELAHNISIHAENNTCLYGFDKGKFYGVVLWNVSSEHKTIHINHLLSTSHIFMTKIIHAFKMMYGDGWSIQGNRHGTIKTIKNTPQFLKRLFNYESHRASAA